MTAYSFPSLQSGDQLVSYYPVKTIYGDISKEWCFRFVSYKGCTTVSKKFLNRIEKALDIRERINAGYSFTGDNSNLPQLGLKPSHLETMQTTNDVKEQLQHDLITLCFSYNPQIPEELINELCQVVVEWDQELID
jgi:hypothetical protein